MPLVFVHGVNTRRGDTPAEQAVFDNRVAFFKQQFRETALAQRVTAPDGLAVFTPYWGDLGVTFRRNLACLPQSGVQTLSVGSPQNGPVIAATAAALDTETLQQPQVSQAPLLTLARSRSLGAAVDLLIAGVATAPAPGALKPTEATLKDAARFAEAAVRYAETKAAQGEPTPAWVNDPALTTDGAFLSRLMTEVTAAAAAQVAPATGATGATGAAADVQTLGIGSALTTLFQNAAGAVRNAVDRITGAAKAAVVEDVRGGYMALSGFLRPAASAMIGRFFGDVFTYMQNRQPIFDRVLADIDKAVEAKRDGDSELYLVGHSFGGIILYDILTTFRPELVCDLYVTVGSQVALFAEIDRLADAEDVEAAFAVSATSTIPRPKNVARWVNVFDPTDLVGFGTRGVFSGAVDYAFDTQAMPIVSHGAYFDVPRLYVRLRERVQDAFANGTNTP